MASTKKKRTTSRAKTSTLAAAAKPVKATNAPAITENRVETAEITAKSPKVFRLFRWNKWLAFVHATQAAVIIVLGVSYKVPVVAHYLTPNPLSENNVSLALAGRQIFEIDLLWLVALFFVLSALAHTAMAGMYRMRYEADLAVGINRLRWIEYAASASTMMVAIALLSGVYDGAALLAIFALTAIMNLCGLAMELFNQGKRETSWLAYGIGCAAGIIPWIIVAWALLSANMYGNGAIPTFVYWIFGSMFVLFSSFAANMYLQYAKKGKWADYLYGERVYMILSLVAKTILAWQVFAGVLRP
jgi:hypothetical protein